MSKRLAPWEQLPDAYNKAVEELYKMTRNKNKNFTTIEELIPYLHDGWVTMDSQGRWKWHSTADEPRRNEDKFYGVNNWCGSLCFTWLDCFNIKPVADWKKSKMRIVGGKIVNDLLDGA